MNSIVDKGNCRCSHLCSVQPITFFNKSIENELGVNILFFEEKLFLSLRFIDITLITTSQADPYRNNSLNSSHK